MVYSQINANKKKSILLLGLFFIIIMVLGYIFGYISQLGAFFGLVFGFTFSLISALISYYFGDKMVLGVSGAKKVNKDQYPFLFDIVENLSLGTGIPMPNLYVISDNSINAFATGRDPNHASVAVTTGSLNKLNKEELEGVLAHEISHITNFDIRLMVLVSVMVGTIVMLSDFFLRSFMFRDSEDRGKSNVIILIIGVVLAILSPIFAELIKLAVSRSREYLADSSGALLTKNPKGLANALKKIANDNNVLHTANHATAHLFISNPFKNKKSWFNSLFSTHPDVNSRIKRLEEL